jgi:xanthine/uracil permease
MPRALRGVFHGFSPVFKRLSRGGKGGGFRAESMNPLFSLWLFVALSMLGVTVIFWLAENYSQYLGNFYVLIGLVFGILIISRLISWAWTRLNRPRA